MMKSALDRDQGGRRGRSLKIDVVVHGRFDAFHLARALLARGHDVRLLTNYPRWAVRRFGLPGDCVSPFTLHGIASRLYARTPRRLRSNLGEAALHRTFGAWAARAVRKDAELVYAFSGVAEELLKRPRASDRPQIWLVRGSAHIRTQHQLLSDEEARVGVVVDKPALWMIEREEREYALAERIVTLSTFAHSTFGERPALAQKAFLLLAAVDTSRFHSGPQVVQERIRRIESGAPLRVLTVGTFSFRKGAHDLVEVAAALHDKMQFRFVGDVPAETRHLHAKALRIIDFRPRIMEFDLVAHYNWADIFVFPTIEDGFAAVVAQAKASSLAVITTPNCSGPDLIRHGQSGWIVPIRNAKGIIDLLTYCDAHRAELAKVIDASFMLFKPRDWSAMAADVETAFAAQA